MIAGKENELINIIKSAISMELRVENSEVENMLNMMDNLGFTPKNSWAAIHVPNHTVVEFWRKEFTNQQLRD